jgi:DNA-binding response OmpR family regulator
MSGLRVLVVEDLERWQELLQETLQRLSSDITIDVAADYEQALQHIADNTYDLATVDLALRGEVVDPSDVDQTGMELLRELRSSRSNQEGCGLIMLTAHGTSARTKEAFREHNVDDFIDKNDFDDEVFLNVARAAIRRARLRRAAARTDARYRLTITLSQERIVGSELDGPDRRAAYNADDPPRINVPELVRRADNLNLLLLRDGPAIWRPEALSIGKAIYDALAEERRILNNITSAREVAERSDLLWLQFSSPSSGLGLPFELLRDEDDYLGMSHIVTRRLLQVGPSFSRKPEAFHSFIERLARQGEMLRVLVVGANSDGTIPAAEDEARALATAIEADLRHLGIEHSVRLLIGDNATRSNVSQALREGRYHIFHYAGHGRFADKLPEISGLVLHEQGEPVTLTASDLNLLTRGTELHMAYLSCCLGARNATQTGRGDFYGVMEAFARADIPVVLGYRWTVADTPARHLAQAYYRALWKTFSPGEALLEARRALALGSRGRDDETCMAPVLLMQNA